MASTMRRFVLMSRGVLTTLNQASALISVVIIDIVLAGDNAIVVGMAAAGLPRAAAAARHPARDRRGDGIAHPVRLLALELLQTSSG